VITTVIQAICALAEPQNAPLRLNVYGLAINDKVGWRSYHRLPLRSLTWLTMLSGCGTPRCRNLRITTRLSPGDAGV
jgi:hypothetical protein